MHFWRKLPKCFEIKAFGNSDPWNIKTDCVGIFFTLKENAYFM
jgi:hypothetical protein